MIYNDDALKVLPTFESNSVDLVITDPPYGISFMGKSWDKALPDKGIWKECLRVLKDGAFAFVMSIPRADCLSRMIISLEDVGFKVGFTPVFWVYASGFPKAQNIGKAVDKKFGAEREVVGIKVFPDGKTRVNNKEFEGWGMKTDKGDIITNPSSLESKALDGSYSFNPKPAVEVIIVAQKPMTEKTFVGQALLWHEERQGVLRGLATELKMCYNIDKVEWEDDNASRDICKET